MTVFLGANNLKTKVVEYKILLRPNKHFLGIFETWPSSSREVILKEKKMLLLKCLASTCRYNR